MKLIMSEEQIGFVQSCVDTAISEAEDMITISTFALEGLLSDRKSLVSQVEEMQKTLTDIQSRCAENSSIWAMAERTLQSLKGAANE